MEQTVENDYMLTTYDNPFNPFEEFDTWYKTDMLLGHDCCGILARNSATSFVFSDEINEKEIDRAMDEIIKQNPTLFRKVLASDFQKVS